MGAAAWTGLTELLLLQQLLGGRAELCSGLPDLPGHCKVMSFRWKRVEGARDHVASSSVRSNMFSRLISGASAVRLIAEIRLFPVMPAAL